MPRTARVASTPVSRNSGRSDPAVPVKARANPNPQTRVWEGGEEGVGNPLVACRSFRPMR